MFKKHVVKKLSAYCDNELSLGEARFVAEHLIGCQRCRKAYEEIKLGRASIEKLQQASAPTALWCGIEDLLDKRSSNAAIPARYRTRFILPNMWQRFAAASLMIILMLGAGTVIRYYRMSRLSENTSPPPQIARVETSERPAAAASSNDTEQAEQVRRVERASLSNASRIESTSETSRSGSETTRRVQSKTRAEGAAAPEISWAVVRLDGAPKIGASSLAGTGRLAVGEWIETDTLSRARIEVADIGQVEIEPNTRVRLVETRSTEHRLALARGRLRAAISAPPRLFFVETPSGVAVDYGCSYTLEVDDAGRSLLHVTAGWVALELNGRESKVPAGAMCATRPGIGPGTPYFEDASQNLRNALRQLDFEGGGAAALNVVLNVARARDSLTLWHLMARVKNNERSRVYERLAAFVAPPPKVTRDGVLRLDRKMLDLWRDELEADWF